MIVFTYPGQGSQAPGMGAAWSDHPSWELVEEASDAVNRDVAALLLDTDADELTMTRNAQLATFITSMVVLDAVSRLGAEAVAHAGHSLGEYSALTAAGALDFSDAVRLVNERGDAMQSAADEQHGTMAALLGLEDDQVDVACQRAAGDVWIANYNAPGQVVIAGVPEDLDRACEIAKELGAKRAMRLPVGGAFHTPLMAPARDRLRKAIDQVEFRAPEQPVYANVDGISHEDAADWPDLLGAQLCSPVRWRQTLRNLETDGFNTYVELGPGTVLTGLVKRTVKTGNRINIATPADLDGLLEQLAGKKQTEAGVLEGEHLFATERLVVSPATGVFTLGDGIETGLAIEVGSVLGTVGTHDVVSSFAGEVMGVLALQGERVGARQPIAWLRTH
ncbi:MAG: [acyl-carrier-protein] S-malonyltransferase [Candidatus Aldehydirespiratoraceae bacterium]|jgi:[acyl-carrier-protein] S-malonyltransferase